VTTEPRSTKLEQRSPVQVGDLVAGKYRVEKLIAAGGMGLIVAARHTTLGQPVAIKILLPDANHATQTERFLREARAAAAIESVHVCRVFDCGELEGGVPFMVMEHLVGQDLHQELKARGPLPVAEVVDLLLQALEGIAEAHAIGIIHRDLKPSNLFLSQRAGRAREVKVLDFGISKLTPMFERSDEEDLTQTEMMLGSPRYMSPEQVQNARGVDARSDIWSIGIILYQLLDGKSPFAGTTMGETIGKVLTHDAPPIRRSRPDVPEGLAAVLDRALQRDRERRYRNVAELALALAPFGSGASQASVQRTTQLLIGGQLAALPGDADDPKPTLAVAPAAAAPHSERGEDRSLGTVGAFTHGGTGEKRARRMGWLIAGMLLLAAAATAALLWSTQTPPPDTATAPSATSPVLGAAHPTASAATVPTAVGAPAVETSPSIDAAALPATQPAPARIPPKRARRSPRSSDDILSESY
jgi:eukaryotic-like serine/threonine-protein kinase